VTALNELLKLNPGDPAFSPKSDEEAYFAVGFLQESIKKLTEENKRLNERSVTAEAIVRERDQERVYATGKTGMTAEKLVGVVAAIHNIIVVCQNEDAYLPLLVEVSAQRALGMAMKELPSEAVEKLKARWEENHVNA